MENVVWNVSLLLRCVHIDLSTSPKYPGVKLRSQPKTWEFFVRSYMWMR